MLKMKYRVACLLIFAHFALCMCVALFYLTLSGGINEQRELSVAKGGRSVTADRNKRSSRCNHPYAAEPDVPFPCATRVTRYNDVGTFFRWKQEEERRKNKLLAPVLRFCAARRVDPFPTVETWGSDTVRATDSLAFLGCGSVRHHVHSGWPAWDYTDGFDIPKDVFLEGSGVVLLSKRLVRESEERAAGVGMSGQWHRCWIIPLTRTRSSKNDTANSAVVYEPTCQAGDVVDVRMESPTAKVAVDRVIDLDNGVLEVQFYIRKRGAYSFSADLLVRHQDMLAALLAVNASGNSSLRSLGRLSSSVLLGSHGTASHGAPGPNIPKNNRTPAYPTNVFRMLRRTGTHGKPFLEHEAVRFDDGVNVIPLPVPCDSVDDFDRFRFGGWYRVGEQCDGVHCITSPLEENRPHPLLISTNGWMWVSDVCQMRLFTDEELLRKIFKGVWFFAWGASTTRDSLTNMLEEHLHTRIFGTFMRDLWRLPKDRDPNFHDYCAWDRCVIPQSEWSRNLFNKTNEFTASSRVTLAWGDCKNNPEDMCPVHKRFSLFQEGINASIGVQARKEQGSETLCGSQGFPDVLLLDHVAWGCEPSTDDPLLLFRTRRLLMNHFSELFKEIVGASSPKDLSVAEWPLTFWHTSPARSNANKSERDGDYYRLRERHLQWAMEDDLASLYRLPEGDSRIVKRIIFMRNGANVTYIQNNNRYPTLTAEEVRRHLDPHTLPRSLAMVPPIVLISRHEITLPLHFGNEFCRDDVHYGSSPAHCLSYSKRKDFGYYDCIRRTWGDTMLQIIWWNAMSRDGKRRGRIR